MVEQKFPAAYRIRRGADFQRAYRRRATASDPHLLIFACDNDLQHPRLGLSVSRKFGGAVKRNLFKRRVREAFRLSLGQLPPGVDLVVIPRGDRAPELGQTRQSLARLAHRAAARLGRVPS